MDVGTRFDSFEKRDGRVSQRVLCAYVVRIGPECQDRCDLCPIRLGLRRCARSCSNQPFTPASTLSISDFGKLAQAP